MILLASLVAHSSPKIPLRVVYLCLVVTCLALFVDLSPFRLLALRRQGINCRSPDHFAHALQRHSIYPFFYPGDQKRSGLGS